MKNKLLMSMAVLGLGAFAFQPLQCFAPSTAARSYDQALRPVSAGKKYRINVTAESSTATRAYNVDAKKCDPMRIYQDSESTLMMLRNPQSSVPSRRLAADNLYAAMAFPADDGKRGHLQLTGSYNEINLMPSIGASMQFKGIPGMVGLDMYVPVARKQVNVTEMEDLTNVTNLPLAADLAVAPYMPGMPDFMAKHGALSTEKVTTTGLGDTAIMLSWRNWFAQDKELIRGVELFAQVGLSLPTGKERDEDKAFSMALGGDGAFGVPVGLGLNVQFINTMRAGLNVDFLAYLDKTRERRLKTHQAQSELFLLNKGKASRDAGLNWQFYLYLQSHHFLGGLSAKAAYQYLRHDADRLSPRDNGFSYDVVNTSNRLSEWYAHNVIFSLDYDHNTTQDHLVVPHLGVFYKLPVGGKAVIAMQSVGVTMGASF